MGSVSPVGTHLESVRAASHRLCFPPRLRELPHQRRHVRPGCQLGDQLLDPALGLVLRPLQDRIGRLERPQADRAAEPIDQEVVRPLANPLSPNGGLAIVWLRYFDRLRTGGQVSTINLGDDPDSRATPKPRREVDG